MTNNGTEEATATVMMDQSCDNFSEDAFATFIDDDNFPGFHSLNNSNFFDQVMNASKIFDGEESLAKLNDSYASLNKACMMHLTKKTSSRSTIKRQPLPSGSLRHDLGEASFWVQEAIEEEDTDKEEKENDDPTFQAEILCAFILNKVAKIAQEKQALQIATCFNGGGGIAKDSVASSSTEGTDSVATKPAQCLVDSMNSAGDQAKVLTAKRKSAPKAWSESRDRDRVGVASESASAYERGSVQDVTRKDLSSVRGITMSSVEQEKRASKTKGKPCPEDGTPYGLNCMATSAEPETSKHNDNVADMTKKALALANLVRGAEEAVRQVKESKMKRNVQKSKDGTKLAGDGGSVATAAESLSSNDSGNVDSVTKKLVSNTEQAILMEKTKVRLKRSSSNGRRKAGHAEVGEPSKEKRRGSQGSGSTPRRSRAGSVDSRLGSSKDTCEKPMLSSSRCHPIDPSSRNSQVGNDELNTLGNPTGERHLMMVPSTVGRETNAVPATPRRTRGLRAERSRSFGPDGTKMSHDVIATSPKTPRRNKTLPFERPTSSSETRRVTRDPRRARRASLGHDMLMRNLLLMEQDDKDDDAVSLVASVAGSRSKERHDVWKQRRLRSFGDATDALANEKKGMERAATIHAATAALRTPRVAAKKMSIDLNSGMSRIALAGFEHVNKDEVYNLSTTGSNVKGKAPRNDDARVPALRHTTGTPVSQRRMRRRGSCAA